MEFKLQTVITRLLHVYSTDLDDLLQAGLCLKRFSSEMYIIINQSGPANIKCSLQASSEFSDFPQIWNIGLTELGSSNEYNNEA